MSKRNYTIHAAGKTEEEANSDLKQKLDSANGKLGEKSLEALAGPENTVYTVGRGTDEVESTLGFGDAANRMGAGFQNPDEYSIEQLYKVSPKQFEALSEERKATAGENLNRRYAVKDITFKL
jgi:hypothetical protein